MNAVISEEERAYSQKIYNFRKQGNIADAMATCKEAIHQYHNSNFFYKIQGDLLFENGDFDEALKYYLFFLERIRNKPEYFTNFAKFFKRLTCKKVVDEDVFNQLAKIINNKKYPYILRKSMTNLLLDTFVIPMDLEEKIDRAINGLTSMQVIKEDYAVISSSGKCREIVYLCKLSEKEYIKEEDKISRYLLKRLEKSGLYEQAIHLTGNILVYSNDAVVIRTLFRLCRESMDYSAAEEYLEKRNVEEVEEFNIQYELVLYFDSIGDEKKRNYALDRIEKLSENSLPICGTLFKFYVKFNMLDKAQIVQKNMMNFKTSKQSQDVQEEAENIVWDRLRTLISEQEHNRQLLALSELIKGFSHELGQPITNIRYAIQLFYMKNKKKSSEIDQEEQELLAGILKQTERIGKLLNRFAPIVSSKSEKKYFNVFTAIFNIFDELSSRLKMEGIQFSVKGAKNVEIYGEELQFGQVFYNLIINSIYAIKKVDRRGEIGVEISQAANILKIDFWDNGIGISPESRRKIFNPFFSTKDKEVEEGGEGLGLFIVWNILKIFSGRIYVDENHDIGARFVMEINLKENGNV